MNQENFGIAEGRLTRDIAVFDNQDGSKKIKLTIAAKDNYKTNGQRGVQYINFEGFLRKEKAAEGLGPYANLAKGDKIGIEYTVRSNNYEKNGEMVYTNVLLIQGICFKESKRRIDAMKSAAAYIAAPDDED